MKISSKPNATVRDSNLELLRIFSMILIVMHHYSVHGNFSLASHALTSNVLFVQLLSLGGKLGVACFILITGYFMITSSFKFKKLLKLILEVLFYSIGLLIIFSIMDGGISDTAAILKSLFPITHSLYWFATTYVVLYLFSPFINVLAKSLTQKMYLLLLSLLFISSSLIPTFLLGSLGVGNVGLFIFLYLTAAYIRMYPNSFENLFSKCKLNYLLAVASGGLLILSVIVFNSLGQYVVLFSEHATYFVSLSSPITLLGAVFLFLGFKNLKIRNNNITNKIAASMFGIYLIHDNIFVRPFLWQTIFQNAAYLDSNILIVHAFIVIGITFVVCLVIDQLRIVCFEKPVFSLYDKFIHNYSEHITRVKIKFESLVHQML